MRWTSTRCYGRGRAASRGPGRYRDDTGGFETCSDGWSRSFGGTLNREVVAIDGKTIRGSFDLGREQASLHVVSAWACDRDLVQGQRQVTTNPTPSPPCSTCWTSGARLSPWTRWGADPRISWRYTHRVAIANSRLVDVTDGQVTTSAKL